MAAAAAAAVAVTTTTTTTTKAATATGRLEWVRASKREAEFDWATPDCIWKLVWDRRLACRATKASMEVFHYKNLDFSIPIIMYPRLSIPCYGSASTGASSRPELHQRLAASLRHDESTDGRLAIFGTFEKIADHAAVAHSLHFDEAATFENVVGIVFQVASSKRK